MMRHISLLFGLALALSATGQARAAQITKLKGTSVLISLGGDGLKSGEDVYAVNSNGKRKAIVRITRIKGNKALGTLIKGKAAPGMNLIPRAGGVIAKRGSRVSEPATPSGLARAYWGALVGYGMDTMSVTVNNANNMAVGTAAMSGGGLSGKVLLDYEIFKQVWFRGTAGVEQFNVTGSSICGTNNKSPCDAKLMYGTLDLAARYVFTTGKFRPWGGLGLGLLFPASKSSTALNAASVGTTNVMQILAGFDVSVGRTMYVPLSVEYGILPKSDQVEAHWITGRVGLAIPF